MKRILVLTVAAGLLVTTTAWAGSLTVTHDFVGGQKALASEVNKNFEDVETEVTDNASGIAQNAADISSNAASILDLKANKLDTPTCSDGQVLKFSSGNWVCGEYLTTLPGVYKIPGNIFQVNRDGDAWSSYYGAYVSLTDCFTSNEISAPFAFPHDIHINRIEVFFEDPLLNASMELEFEPWGPNNSNSPTTIYFGVDNAPGSTVVGSDVDLYYSNADDAYFAWRLNVHIDNELLPLDGQCEDLKLFWIKIYYTPL